MFVWIPWYYYQQPSTKITVGSWPGSGEQPKPTAGLIEPGWFCSSVGNVIQKCVPVLPSWWEPFCSLSATGCHAACWRSSAIWFMQIWAGLFFCKLRALDILSLEVTLQTSLQRAFCNYLDAVNSWVLVVRGWAGGLLRSSPDVVRASGQQVTLELIFFALLCSGTLITSWLLFIACVKKINSVFWHGILSSQ